MATSIDYRQRLLDETSDLSPYEMQKIYETVVFLKEKFILADEARYDTSPGSKQKGKRPQPTSAGR